jgi:RND family efflux transporter MFP subunit
MMKRILILWVVGIFIISCKPTAEEGMPAGLSAKKALLKEKKTELKELTAYISEITDSIKAQDPAFEEKRRLVSVSPVSKKEFNRYVSVQGLVMSDDVVNATAEVPGRITKLYVKEGQSVKKGQLIARLDLESVQKQINELETSLSLATTVFDRQKRLWDQNIGSEIQYLEAKNNKERLEKSLETLSFQLSKASIYSPISGVVDRELIKQGEIASPGMPIVVILNTRNVKVVADVSESFLGVVNKKDKVQIIFPALNREIEENISLIGRTIDPANRTFTIEVNTKNQDGLLKPNLLAELRFKELSIKDAIVIPLDVILQEVSGKEYVFIKQDSDNGPIASKKYVQRGESYLSEVVITEGLSGDEEIIIDGNRLLTNNEPIQIIASR